MKHLVGLLLTLALPASASELPWPVASHVLDNGLQVHVVPMPSPGVVAWQAWVRVGSGHEVMSGRTGFAHFFEHLMFFGTEALPLEAREREVLRLGADENAWTWVDQTVYHAVVPARHLPRWSALEADRFQRLHLQPEDVRREAGAVHGEWRKSVASPDEELYRALMATAFQVHPYGHDTLGLEADIAAMPDGWRDALDFFATWYRPERTTIVVAGDVVPEQVFALVEQDWAGWRPAPAELPEIPSEPEQTEPRRVEVPWAGPTAPRMVMAWKSPAHDPESQDVAALHLAADLLLASDGPLQRRLVREEGLAFDVGGGQDAWASPGLFRIEAHLTDEAHLPRVEAVIREEVAKLSETTAAELDDARTSRRYGWLTSLDDPDAVAYAIGEAALLGGSPDALGRFLRSCEAVEPADLARVAATWLTDARLTVAVLRPTESP